MLRLSSRGVFFTGSWRGPMVGGSVDIAEGSSKACLLTSPSHPDKCMTDALSESESESLRSEYVEGLLFLVLDGFMAGCLLVCLID